jgi:inosose dehydratase
VGLGFRDADRYDAEMAKAMAIVERLHATGGKLLIAAEAGDDRRRGEAGHVDPAGGLTDEQWRNLASGLHDLADRIAPLGMTVVFHNHVGTYVETPTETARLLDETDPARVGWCLDIGHLAYGGGDSLAMLGAYGDRVAHIHLKDVDGDVLARAKADGWSFGEALKAFIFPPLGEGIARVPEVVAALLGRGYDGWFVLEQDTTAGDPMVTARRNREYLEALLAGAGSA